MSTTALAFVVAAAFIHAYWNLLVKRAEGGAAFVWLFSLASALLYAPVIVVLVLIEPLDYGPLAYTLIFSSGILHLLYAVTLNRGYNVGDLSVVYPIARGTGPLISSIGAMLLLGERPTLVGAIGIVLIVVGIVLIAGAWSPALYRHSRRAAKGLTYGALTGICIASYTVNDAYAVKVLLVSPVMIDYFGNVVRLAFPYARDRVEAGAAARGMAEELEIRGGRRRADAALVHSVAFCDAPRAGKLRCARA